MPKYCASGLCKNNAKDNPSKKFALFVQTAGRNKDLERAKRWIQLMGRANFSVEHIKSYIYVCEDHFDENVELDYRKVREYNILEKFQFSKRRLDIINMGNTYEKGLGLKSPG